MYSVICKKVYRDSGNLLKNIYVNVFQHLFYMLSEPPGYERGYNEVTVHRYVFNLHSERILFVEFFRNGVSKFLSTWVNSQSYI